MAFKKHSLNSIAKVFAKPFAVEMLQANLQQLGVDSQCAQGADFAKGYNQILQADGGVTLGEYCGTVHAQWQMLQPHIITESAITLFLLQSFCF